MIFQPSSAVEKKKFVSSFSFFEKNSQITTVFVPLSPWFTHSWQKLRERTKGLNIILTGVDSSKPQNIICCWVKKKTCFSSSPFLFLEKVRRLQRGAKTFVPVSLCNRLSRSIRERAPPRLQQRAGESWRAKYRASGASARNYRA